MLEVGRIEEGRNGVVNSKFFKNLFLSFFFSFAIFDFQEREISNISM